MTTTQKPNTDSSTKTAQPNQASRPGMQGGNAGGARGARGRGGPGGGRGFASGGRRDARPRPEFDQSILSIRRVTRVMAGGRRMSFSVAIAIGDKRGSVGVGLGKAGDTAQAIEKAYAKAKKNMTKINLTENMSIPYDVEAKYCGSRVHIMPAPGKGVVAGSSARKVIELAGAKEVGAKLYSRSKNQLNNARATIKALQKIS